MGIGMVVLRWRFRRDDGMSRKDEIIHTIGEQLSKGGILIRFQTAGEHALAAPPCPRHQRAPQVTNDNFSPFCSQRLSDGLSSFGVRPGVLGTATAVNTSVRARLLGELILVYGWGGDNDNAWVVREKEGVGENGKEVLAVGLEGNVLVADAAEVTGVVGTEEEGLVGG